jgi:hypothetical protein
MSPAFCCLQDSGSKCEHSWLREGRGTWPSYMFASRAHFWHGKTTGGRRVGGLIKESLGHPLGLERFDTGLA